MATLFPSSSLLQFSQSLFNLSTHTHTLPLHTYTKFSQAYSRGFKENTILAPHTHSLSLTLISCVHHFLCLIMNTCDVWHTYSEGKCFFHWRPLHVLREWAKAEKWRKWREIEKTAREKRKGRVLPRHHCASNNRCEVKLTLVYNLKMWIKR